MEISDSLILDATPDAMVVVDAEGIVKLINQQAERLFGYDRRELLGASVEVLMPERLRDLHAKHRQNYNRAPAPRLFGERKVLIAQRKDGSEFAAEISLSPITTDDGLFIASAIRDVSSRTQEDQKLRELLDSSPDAMVVVNQSGEMVLVNAQAVSLFGYKREDLVGKTVELLLPERYRTSHPRHREDFFDAARRRGMGEGQVLYGLKSDGSEFPIEISLSPVHTAEEVLVASAIRDIRSHIEAEEELQRAKELAESAAATKTRFLAAASHDLRQPLQSIGLYLAVLDRHIEIPKQLEITAKIRSSLNVMAELLDSLLDISRLDSASITPEKINFPLDALITRIVDNNRPHAESKGLDLIAAPTSLVVHSDPGLFERIIENFVTNAIRYSESGQIRIDCEQVENTVRIDVADTGIGIPEEELGKIFEEYYQLDNNARDRTKGLGLGLSIVSNIARTLDHPLSVTSCPGEGSTFSVTVPVGEITDGLENPTLHSQAADSTQVTVLFVDDDPAIVDATTMLLEASGYDVHSASNGDEALAQITAGLLPDVVISDYRLPGFNGVDLIRRINKLQLGDVPAVIITGDTSSKEINAAHLPVCKILHKPIDTDALLEAIREYAGVSS